MRFDYNVLSVDVDGVIDTLAVHIAYVAGGHDGVYLRVARSARLRDLEFLRDLPGLRYVEVLGPVVDDTAALLIPGVREVCLLTRCKKALPDLSGSTVWKIGLDSRPGLEQVAAGGLDEFSVWGWRGTDFRFLGDQPGLRRLKVEATRQLVSLEGLQHCRRLEYIELLALRATGLAPLAQASRLQHLWIIGDLRITGEVTLDLADLADLPELTEIRIGFGGAIATLSSAERSPGPSPERLPYTWHQGWRRRPPAAAINGPSGGRRWTGRLTPRRICQAHTGVAGPTANARTSAERFTIRGY